MRVKINVELAPVIAVTGLPPPAMLRSTIVRHLTSSLLSLKSPIPTHSIRPALSCASWAQSRPASSAPADREANDRRRKRPLLRRIRTLDPARLQPSDSIDISGRVAALVWALGGHDGPRRSRLLYDRAPADGSRVPFPAGTQGFLYYEGHDLLRASGVPWHVSPGVLARPSHAGLAGLLREEGLVAPAQLAAWASWPKAGKRVLGAAPVVERFGRPFPVNFARSALVVWLRTKEGAGYARIGMEAGPQKRAAFMHGAGVACFEPSTRGKDGRKVAVVRILKITEPVGGRPGVPLRALPVEGELLAYPRTGRLVSYPADGKLMVCRALRAFWEDHERRTAVGSESVAS
ncbi:hypothetical protein BC834DRAFT_972209 [Gloeopeniophorella convolvens]|nr:hypothetical protein BC834DRAFT_972209 [Gloeopeniophorella convolvens]